MAYKIIVQDSAIADANEYAAYNLEYGTGKDAADRWLDELEQVVASLSEMPRRFKVIEEQGGFRIELRQVRHYSHRVVFHVTDEKSSVFVLRIYHGARRTLEPLDIKVFRSE